MLGLTESGKLSLQYLQNRFASLPKGGIYELMCHPGMTNPDETIEPRLKDYHDWDSECKLLCGNEFRKLLQQHEIQLIGYRNLETHGNRVEIAGGES